MVDVTTGHEVLSFMDGLSGYNQIRVSPKDEECTTFCTPKGIYCYKMNPLKCAFSVMSGKFLDFIIPHRGIEVNPAKVDAIQKIPPPRNLKELRSLHGNLAFTRRFISNLVGRC
ncbi:UNVERIFIED_CONTAM: hypothetical protein Scaly_0599100 [Sesamum calycinum]|uniref:Transposon Ty3-I Gag-Pol polyprotein n=1 Tax=Sesamum calycinum TaxID=2727403 RepID=A0AAW2RUI8_9LAMI